MAADVVGLGDQRLLVGVAVRDQGPVGRRDQREPALPDPDAIDHAPHLLEVQFTDQPAGRLVEAHQRHGEHARRQQVVVDAQRRHRDAIEHDRRVGRHGHARRADAARGDDAAILVEQGQLAELAELQDVVPQDGRLLPLLEAGVLELRGEGLQNLGVAGDIAPDLLGTPRRAPPVAGDDRFTRAAAEREDRDQAVADERHDGRERQNQRELAADTADSKAGHGQFVLCQPFIGRRPPEPQRAEDVAPGFDRNLEASADRPGPLAPGEENRRRIVDDRLLEGRDTRLVRVVCRGMLNLVEARRRLPCCCSGA